MTAGPEYSEEDIALAGEFVLDLLPAGEREAFEQRLANDPYLRRLVMEWDEGFVPLTDALPAIEPPAMVRARIEARLFPEDRRGRLTSWFRPWMGAAGGAIAAALVVLAVIFTDPAGPALPTHRAALGSTDGALQISASLNADTGNIAVTRLAGGASPNRVLELWLIVEGDNTPKSLGLLGASETTNLTLDADLRDRLSGALLAVSDEPPGGSPTGAPTGVVLAVGEVSILSDA